MFIKRTNEIQLLHSYKDATVLFIYGNEGVGKTAMLKDQLPEYQYVNCLHYAHDISALHLDITQDLSIILDNIHLVRHNREFMQHVVRLQEQTPKSVRVVLVSHVNWESFNLCGLSNPLQIHLADYRKNDTLEILQLDFSLLYHGQEAEIARKVYQKFCELIYDDLVFINSRLPYLRYIVKLMFPTYVQNMLSDMSLIQQCHQNEDKLILLYSRLFAQFKPYMRDVLNAVYLHDISASEYQKLQQPQDLQQLTIDHHQDQLPFHSKFLLIASFLASYNPAKFDAKFFSKRNESKRRGGQVQLSKKDARFTTLQTGPKAFEVDRMLAVFHAIVGENVEPSIDLQQQVATLISLKLLTRCTVSLEKSLECMRLKVNVSLFTMRRIAESVDFKLDQYLYK